MNKGVYVVLFVLLAPAVLAGVSQEIELDVQANGVVTETITLSILSDEDLPSISYATQFYPYDLVIDDDLSYVLLEDENYRIKIQERIPRNTETTLSFQFTTTELVKKEDQQLIFSSVFAETEGSKTIKLILPVGFALADIRVPVTPTPDSITSDGRHIILTWNDKYEELNLLAIITRNFSPPSSNLLGWIYGIVIAFLGIIIFIFLRTQKHVAKSLGDTLGQNEKKLIWLISDSQGMTQKDLVKLSGYSKSRVSKLVARLEQKGFLSKEEHFKTYKLRVKKKIG